MRKSLSVIRVLVVDEHPLIRYGIASVLANEKGILMVGEVGDAAQALSCLRSLRPNVVLMDIQLSSTSGGDAVLALVEADRRVRIIVLTALSGDLSARRALTAGARAYLLKQRARTELADAIRGVMEGRCIVDPEVRRELEARSNDEDLTLRELQVLRLVADGLANREIGERLSISEGTVKNHVKHILRKLGAADRTHAAVIGVARGALDKL
jgi:DNA-binding NarL/FixJ family response regulator